MSEQLFLKCEVCGAEFRSELDIDRTSIDVFAGNALPCPDCGTDVVISDDSLVFKP